MSFYDIDFPSFVKQRLPVRLRQSRTVRWLQCLITPVLELYHLFTDNRAANLYILAHTSQVVYVQVVLNDTFDPVGRGIYITDGGTDDPLYTYLIAENEPLWLGLISEIGTTSFPDPQWLYTVAETEITGYSFIVKIPLSVTYDTQRMKALIDKYRLASKNNYLLQGY